MNPSNSRRTLIKRIAAVAAGSIGPVLAPGTVAGLSPTTWSPLSKAANYREEGEVVCSDGATVVETSSGRIRGFKRNGVYTFRGVPYGASTSGSRRFMPPAPPDPWTGIRNALA